MFCVGQSRYGHKRKYRKKKFIIRMGPRETESLSTEKGSHGRDLPQPNRWKQRTEQGPMGRCLYWGVRVEYTRKGVGEFIGVYYCY